MGMRWSHCRHWLLKNEARPTCPFALPRFRRPAPRDRDTAAGPSPVPSAPAAAALSAGSRCAGRNARRINASLPSLRPDLRLRLHLGQQLFEVLAATAGVEV